MSNEATITLANAEAMSVENLTKAGIETKITRSELSDYIVGRIQNGLHKEMTDLYIEIHGQKPTGSYFERDTLNIPLPLDSALVKPFIDLVQSVSPCTHYQSWIRYDGNKYGDTTTLHIGGKNGEAFIGAQQYHPYSGSVHMSFPIEIEKLTEDAQDKIKKAERIRTLAATCENADKKKYKQQMVRTLLNSSAAGLALQNEIKEVVSDAISRTTKKLAAKSE
jgi:hypothetical protein